MGMASSARRWSPLGGFSPTGGRMAPVGGEGRGHQPGDLGPEPVVGVEEDHSVPPATLESGIEGRSLAATLLEDHVDTVGERRQDLTRVVGRAVVDDDHVDVRMGLRAGALERFGEEAPVVVVGDDDVDRQVAGRHVSHRRTVGGSQVLTLR
jgi:hypothetical protein